MMLLCTTTWLNNSLQVTCSHFLHPRPAQEAPAIAEVFWHFPSCVSLQLLATLPDFNCSGCSFTRQTWLLGGGVRSMREEEGVESLPRFRLRGKHSVLTMFFFANPKNKQIKKQKQRNTTTWIVRLLQIWCLSDDSSFILKSHRTVSPPAASRRTKMCTHIPVSAVPQNGLSLQRVLWTEMTQTAGTDGGVLVFPERHPASCRIQMQSVKESEQRREEEIWTWGLIPQGLQESTLEQEYCSATEDPRGLGWQARGKEASGQGRI